MKRLGLIIGLAASLVWGCKKEPLPTAVPGGEPVFYVSCAINNVRVKLEAGNQGYSMVPGFSMDSNSVYVLESLLSNTGCSSCYEMIVKINDHMVSHAGDPIHIDSALKRGYYLFNDHSAQPTNYDVKLKGEFFDPSGIYKWTISEPNKADVELPPGYEQAVKLNALTSYTVSLEYVDAQGLCSKTHYGTLKLGAGPEVNVTGTRPSATAPNIYNFTAIAGATPIQHYSWDFGDGTPPILDVASPTHTFPASGGYYDVTLTATDASGQQSITHYQIASVDGLCTANFDAEITPVPNNQAFSKVTVEVKDPTGARYSTRDFVQPAESSFEIVEVNDYQSTPQGLKTKRFKALFNCVLKTGGSTIRITGGEAVMAVAYE